MDVTVQFKVNGRDTSLTTDPQRSLLDVLREDLELTGAKYACGEGKCGSCSVLIDGQREFSCVTPISQVQGKSIMTIEGLAQAGTLHPVQESFLEERAIQCGYCTSGMILTAAAFLSENSNPSDQEIARGMNGNICRCNGYLRIISAVRRAAKKMAR